MSWYSHSLPRKDTSLQEINLPSAEWIHDFKIVPSLSPSPASAGPRSSTRRRQTPFVAHSTVADKESGAAAAGVRWRRRRRRRGERSGREWEGLKKCPELTPPARRKPRLRGEKPDRTRSGGEEERTRPNGERTKDEREYRDVILESVC